MGAGPWFGEVKMISLQSRDSSKSETGAAVESDCGGVTSSEHQDFRN